MKRLRGLPDRLTAPSPRLAGMATAGTGFARANNRTRQQRGYDADWDRVRALVLAEERGCRLCGSDAHPEVDHIQAFRGRDDPLRLRRSNLRRLCRPCHRSRTARQSHGQG